MNQKLRFSFSHIVAFIVLVFISYITFLGLYYKFDGDYRIGIGGAIGISFILFFIYQRLQSLKGTEKDFISCRKYERGFLVVFVIAVLLAFIPFSHFWTVRSNEKEIVSSFRGSLASSEKIFTDYEEYAKSRINAYRQDLKRAEGGKITNPQQYTDYGLDKYSVDELVEMMELQLVPPGSYENDYKKKKLEWVHKSENGATVWNPFMLSNIKVVESAANEWIEDLHKMSLKVPENERTDFAVPFTYSISFEEVTHQYTSFKRPALLGILVGACAYFLLLFPYLLQERHSKTRNLRRTATTPRNTERRTGRFRMEDFENNN